MINKLISEMLGLFQARLKVFEWDRHQLVTSTSKKLQDNQIGRPPQSVQDAILEEVEGMLDDDLYALGAPDPTERSDDPATDCHHSP